MNAVVVVTKVAATVNYNCKLIITLTTSGRCHNDKLNFDLKLHTLNKHFAIIYLLRAM
jgi:hypothetical protein